MDTSWLIAAVLLTACSGPGTYLPRPASDNGDHSAADLADDDEPRPGYGKPELERALIAERGAEATAERVIAGLEAAGHDVASDDAMRVAVADLAVRRQFITALASCQASGRACPPRLDDPPWSFDHDAPGAKPPLDTPLRFDRETWQKLTAELHGRACACRTIACVDGIGVAIDQLEPRPMLEVQGDEVASQSITRARQCLFRLRGKAAVPRVRADALD